LGSWEGTNVAIKKLVSFDWENFKAEAKVMMYEKKRKRERERERRERERERERDRILFIFIFSLFRKLKHPNVLNFLVKIKKKIK